MLRVGSREVDITNADRVLFPDDGITKGDLVEYYLEIAPVMLPHARGRPLTMQRFPDGVGGEGFYQQRRPAHFPDWVPGIEVARAERGAGTVEHAVCRDAAALVYLANQGAITLHGWLSREDDLEHPDRMVFDLDPPDGDVEALLAGARAVRALLDVLELPSFVMTTGSNGLHVVVPLQPVLPFDDVRQFARAVADRLAETAPDSLTTEARINKRRGRLYLDVGRNAWGQTAVLPYSVRAKPTAPVATPLDWDELGRAGFSPRRYHLGNILRRLAQKDDPWERIDRHRTRLDRARRRLADAAPSTTP